MKKTIYPWINILLGCTILAAGFVFFINPYNIIPGGVYGASIVLHNLFPSIQVGTFGYMFDIPRLILRRKPWRHLTLRNCWEAVWTCPII